MDEFQIKLKPSPEKKANFLSRMFFCFLTRVMRLGYKRPLEVTDLYEVLPDAASDHLCKKFEREWIAENALAKKEGRKPQLKWPVIHVFGKEFLFAGFVTIVEEAIKVVQAFLMRGLIRYFQAGQTSVSYGEAFGYACGMACCAMSYGILHHPHFYHLQRIGMKIRISCGALVYKKSLTVSSAALRKTTGGRVVNLLANDMARFDQAFLYLHYLWAAPLSLCIFTVLLWDIIGPACLAGFTCLAIVVSVQAALGRLMGKFRKEVAERADKRIGIMGEVLNGMRVIKMYAWEKLFSDLVDKARMAEIKKLRVQAFLQAMIMGLYFCSAKMVVLSAVVAFVLNDGGANVTAEKIFVACALFNMARMTATLYLPFAVQYLSETRVAFQRIEEFLLLEDKQSSPAASKRSKGKKQQSPASVVVASETGYAEMVNFCAKWDDDQTTLTLDRISFSVKPGQLLLIVGPVGSGKSTILLSLLGESKQVGGQMRLQGSVAYVPQEAWVFSASLRRNVTFGTPNPEVVDTKRYQKALSVSALKKDVENMPNRDGTFIGDKGVGLSGGQRARVNLARAVYNNADVYLLDDPLSAVDSEVGRAIFEKCILGHLRKKPRILVTHQLQFLPKADHILVVKGGRVVASGTFKQLQSLGDEFIAILKECEDSYRSRDSSSLSAPHEVEGIVKGIAQDSEKSKEKESKEKEDEPKSDQKSLPSSKGSMRQGGCSIPRVSASLATCSSASIATAMRPQDEEQTAGAVSCKVYYEYFSAMGNCCVVILLFVFCFFVQGVFSFSDYWLNVWTTKTEYEEIMKSGSNANVTRPVSVIPGVDKLSSKDCLTVYAVVVLTLFVTSLARSTIFRYMLTRSSFVLHSRMFRAIIRTPVIFFDQNPVGRILNRFSRDCGTMDELLSYATFDFLQGFINFIGVIVVVCACNPWIVLPAVPLVIAFICVRYYYMETARSVKRLEATTKSPVFTHVAATLDGLATIRAFAASHHVIENFHHFQDIHSAAFSLFLSTSRWFALYIDCLCATFIGCVGFVSVLASASQQSSGSVGLALFTAMTLMGFFQWMIRQSTEMENMMVSVERILEYSRLPPEPGLIDKNRKKGESLPATWPEKGEIKFDHVSMKYVPEGPTVLSDINIVIKPAEKIGIVGRTGAGKSTLLTALFRLSEPTGVTTIDGVNIRTLDLHYLRQRISIIPQMPVLFIGTLRQNLDPFSEFKDFEIWAALEQVELKGAVDQMADGLATLMQEGGGNLSIGQRQLVCLARAILRNNKVLVVDEATANVDLHTDAMIQRTIRHKFKNCTVLTIAHRLNTIMDSTRVIVMEKGQIIEFDAPAILLRKPESTFSKLVQQTGRANAEKLIKLAEESYAKDREEAEKQKKAK